MCLSPRGIQQAHDVEEHSTHSARPQVWPDAQELVPILTEQLRTAILSAPSLDGLLDSVSVTGRVKTPTSTLRKLLRDVDHVESVRDVLAFRVVLKASGTASQELAATMSKPGSRLLSDEEVEALLCYGAYKQVRLSDRSTRYVSCRRRRAAAHPLLLVCIRCCGCGPRYLAALRISYLRPRQTGTNRSILTSG